MIRCGSVSYGRARHDKKHVSLGHDHDLECITMIMIMMYHQKHDKQGLITKDKDYAGNGTERYKKKYKRVATDEARRHSNVGSQD